MFARLVGTKNKTVSVPEYLSQSGIPKNNDYFWEVMAPIFFCLQKLPADLRRCINYMNYPSVYLLFQRLCCKLTGKSTGVQFTKQKILWQNSFASACSLQNVHTNIRMSRGFNPFPQDCHYCSIPLYSFHTQTMHTQAHTYTHTHSHMHTNLTEKISIKTALFIRNKFSKQKNVPNTIAQTLMNRIFWNLVDTFLNSVE